MCCDGDGDVMLTTGAYRAGAWLYMSHMHVYMYMMLTTGAYRAGSIEHHVTRACVMLHVHVM